MYTVILSACVPSFCLSVQCLFVRLYTVFCLFVYCLFCPSVHWLFVCLYEYSVLSSCILSVGPSVRYLSVRLCAVCLSVCILSFCPSVYCNFVRLYIITLSVCALSVCLSVYRHYVRLCTACLPVCTSVSGWVNELVCLSTCVSGWMADQLNVCIRYGTYTYELCMNVYIDLPALSVPMLVSVHV